MTDPYAGRDRRARLIAERPGFERIEPMTRRSLVLIGAIAAAAGAAQLLFHTDRSARAQPWDRGRGARTTAE